MYIPVRLGPSPDPNQSNRLRLPRFGQHVAIDRGIQPSRALPKLYFAVLGPRPEHRTRPINGLPHRVRFDALVSLYVVFIIQEIAAIAWHRVPAFREGASRDIGPTAVGEAIPSFPYCAAKCRGATTPVRKITAANNASAHAKASGVIAE